MHEDAIPQHVKAGASFDWSVRFDAVIFDLDGTLVDTEPLYELAERRYLSGFGIVYDDELRARMIGKGLDHFFGLLEELFPDNPLNALPRAERESRYFKAYTEASSVGIRVFPPMKALVEELAMRGMPRCIASGSSTEVIERVTVETGLARLIPERLSSDRVARGKPFPDVFLEAARRLGAMPGRCLVFEDSLPGLEAARAAGMSVVLLPAPGYSHPSHALADLVVPGGPDAADHRRLLRFIYPE